MLQIPFYVCEGRRCAQTSLKSILAYRGENKSSDELDKLVGAYSENPVPMLSVANALNRLNINFVYLVKPSFEIMSIKSLEKITCDFYPRSISSRFNLDYLKESFDNIKRNKLYEVYNLRPTLDEIEIFIDNGKIPLCLINVDRLINRKDKKRGHYLTLTGIGKKYVYAHDSGPVGAMPNRPIEKNRFLDCWNLGIFDWDVLIV